MGHDAAAHGNGYYIKIWATLMVLLVISLVGPTLGILVVTLITAFGVAVVKATMVMAYFMHLNVEKKYIWGLLLSALVFILGLFFGIAPDIMANRGHNWVKCNGYDAKNLARFAHMGLAAEEIGLNKDGKICTPQRF